MQLRKLAQIECLAIYSGMNTFAISGMTCANCARKVATAIQCAGLGAVFQLPMSVVTIVENVGMAAMAAMATMAAMMLI